MQFRLPLPTLAPESPIRLVRRLFGETMRTHIVGYAIAFLFMFMVAGSTALSAWIMKDVINQVFVERNFGKLVLIAGAIVVISLARGIGLYGSTVSLAIVGNKIIAHTQERLFAHLLTLGNDFYSKHHSSQLITRISNNANAARVVLQTVITSFGRDLLTLIGLVAVMVVQSPLMSVITFVIGPIAIYGITTVVKRVRGIAKLEIQGIAKMIASMQETIEGIRIVKAFNLEDIMRVRMHAAITYVRRRSDKIARVKARMAPFMELLGGLAMAAVMLWAGLSAINYGTQPGAFMSFITAILLAYEPAKRLADTRVTLERGMVGVRLMYKILDTKPTMDANLDGPDLEVRAGQVKFDSVSFGYRRGAPALRKLTLDAPAGQVTALVGPSGAGKSTIINLIERFYDVGSGLITIDGQDISKVRLASLRGQLSLVSQDTFLFRASIRDNIRFGRQNATDAEVEEAARNAMAHDFIMAMKQGYETDLDDGGVSLSGGQRQRLAIARAMLREAPINLLDEATSSLDSESEHQVQVAFDRLMRGRTTIVIAHRLSTILNADQICVVARGRIVEKGRHAELLAARGHYARLYHLQFEKPGASPPQESEEIAPVAAE
jgi:ATP-binding cassette subfamily B protein